MLNHCWDTPDPYNFLDSEWMFNSTIGIDVNGENFHIPLYTTESQTTTPSRWTNEPVWLEERPEILLPRFDFGPYNIRVSSPVIDTRLTYGIITSVEA